MRKKSINMDIPKEKFELVNQNVKIKDQVFDTKPVGYFKDALIRFTKNKGSVVAFSIIVVLVLFAIIFPFVATSGNTVVNDSYYAKKTARLTWAYNIGINGSTKKDYNANVLANYYSLGYAAEYRYDEETGEEHLPTVEEAKSSYYQPVVKIHGSEKVMQGKNESYIFHANVDSYLGVGFIYVQLTQDQYKELYSWQKANDIQVIYPLLNTSDPNCLDPTNANYWYKMSKLRTSKGAPINSKGKAEDFNPETTEFVDLYLRDKDGKPVFYKYQGGGTTETAAYQVRVLYYNYYRYKYGQEPNFIFGTDSQGYDFAYRLATGMRLSFILSVCVSVINFIIGAIYGAIEGYYGGLPDLIMERITDILVEVPFIVVATLFQLHIANKVGGFVSLLFAFILTGWIGTASRVRSQFYRFKNQEYVLAARTLGARDARIMWKHIFPNTLGTIITSSVLVIPGVIFSESMLSYLGIVNLGTATSTSLGTLLSEASKIWTEFPHLMIFPAIIISLLMICFNLFGNGLRDAFNPTLRGAE